MRAAIALLVLVNFTGIARAQLGILVSLDQINEKLAGRIDNYTHNHRRFNDQRIPSKILGMKRDLYVYVPPGYDPSRQYPLVLWLHGGFGDEHAFLLTANITKLDKMIACGEIPPMIVACPDGTYSGRNMLTTDHSLYANGRGGRVADHIMQEVIPWLLCHYSIDPRREMHGLAGISAGGTGAMNLALKNRDFFSAAASASGALNLRYAASSGGYFADFSPLTFLWKTTYAPRQIIGRFGGGVIRVRARAFIGPVFGSDPDLLERVKEWNPADLIQSTDLQPGELKLYVRYGSEDNLNLDAHGASFAYLARQRGIEVDEVRIPGATHDGEFFVEGSAEMFKWLGRHFAQHLP